LSRSLSQDDLARFKAQLCDVAAQLFAEHGAENVSMRQIAAAMGISPMTPYRYFANRDEILAAVRIRGFEAFAAALEEAYASTPGDSDARGRAAGMAYIGFAFANANTYRLMFETHQQEDSGEGPLGAAVARARATLSVYGEELIAQGVPETAARSMETLIWSTLHGAVTLEMAGTTPSGSAQEVLALLGQLRLSAP
jgi:AcrR family transcriptional regulator